MHLDWVRKKRDNVPLNYKVTNGIAKKEVDIDYICFFIIIIKAALLPSSMLQQKLMLHFLEKLFI